MNGHSQPLYPSDSSDSSDSSDTVTLVYAPTHYSYPPTLLITSNVELGFPHTLTKGLQYGIYQYLSKYLGHTVFNMDINTCTPMV